jgi:4-amino-4-deoxy-L-arabinose transferase-like glycosyltransferase
MAGMKPIRDWLPPFSPGRLGLLGLALALVLGVVLRLVWVNDMEYKEDEAWTFARTQQIGRTEPLTWRGMPSSAGFDHPGLSLWIFLGLAKVFAVHEPTQLARAVQLVNLAALLLLVGFAFHSVPAEEREPWLWAAALASVNPMAVLFQRKIWLPSILPIFSLAFLACWWHRRRAGPAFLWGLLGACMGQIQLTGFFFAAGFVVWVLLFDRKSVAWGSWLVGSLLGALPLIPWLRYVVAYFGEHHTTATFRWYYVFRFRFYELWATEPFGFGLPYAIGADFDDFLTYPHFGGRPTYLVGALHGLLIGIWLLLLLRGGYLLWRDRRRWAVRLIGRSSPTAFTLSAALWGFGTILTLTALTVQRHYLLILFPLTFVWVARLALAGSEDRPASLRRGRAVLAVLCAAQLLLSAGFLDYIHVNRGAVYGDYGVAYGAQDQPGVCPP